MKVSIRTVFLGALLAAILALGMEYAHCQTTINGSRTVSSGLTVQGTTTTSGALTGTGTVTFEGTTKTVNFEASLPATCTAPAGSTPGELVFRTSDNTLHACTATNTFTQVGGGSGYSTIQDETTPLTQRATVNFAGAGVACADDTTRTTCTIAGGGGGWILAATWSHAISGDTASPIQFTGLAGANDILIIADSTTVSTNGSRQVQVSVDNGSSYFTNSGDYIAVSAAGVRSNSGSMCGGFADSTAARSVLCLLVGTNVNGAYKTGSIGMTGDRRIFVASLSPINAVQYRNQNGGNFTGGIIYVLTK